MNPGFSKVETTAWMFYSYRIFQIRWQKPQEAVTASQGNFFYLLQMLSDNIISFWVGGN